MNKNNLITGTLIAVSALALTVVGVKGYSLATKKEAVIAVYETKLQETVTSVKNVSGKNVGGVTFTNPEKPAAVKTVKKVKNLEVNLSRLIELYGPISGNAVEASIRLSLMDQQSSKDITIVIDSPGGSVVDGARLISAMQAARSKIRTICLSMCASMGFMIHQYGTERLALDRAILMAHPASGGVRGDVDNMANQLKTIQRYINKMEAEVGARMGLSFETYKAKVAQEYWIDAEDALVEKALDGLVSISIERRSEAMSFSPEQRRRHALDIIWIAPGYAN